MTPEEQLQLWVDGKPTHNPTADECTPDFSCCNPELLQPQSVREAFQAAYLKRDTETVFTFLSIFMQAFLQHRGDKRKVLELIPPGTTIRFH